jgi:hypothetical protein
VTVSPRYTTEPAGVEGLLFTVVVRNHKSQVEVLAKSEL